MKWVLTALTYLLSLAAVCVVSFFAVIVLAGPHADMLPQPLQVVVMIAAWAAVLVLPVVAARAVWRRSGRRSG